MSINKNFICLIEGYRNTMNDIPLLMEEYDSILRQTLESAQTRILKKKKKDFTKFFKPIRFKQAQRKNSLYCQYHLKDNSSNISGGNY